MENVEITSQTFNADALLAGSSIPSSAEFITATETFVKGDSAYKTWTQQEGNEGKTEQEFLEWLQGGGGSIPEEELQSIYEAINGKVDKIVGKGLSTNDYTTQEKSNLANALSRISILENSSGSILSFEERIVSSLLYGGKTYPIYELTAELIGLSTVLNDQTNIVILESPIGGNLYLNVESLSISTSAGFSPNAYQIKEIFTNEEMSTVISLVCKEESLSIEKVIVTIRYVKGIVSYDTFNISIPILQLGISSAEDIEIKIPSLKYDKKMVMAWTTDDSLLCVYSYLHKLINKKYIDDVYNFHDWMTPTTGFIPSKTLGSTDGCGNEVRFRVDSAWFSFNSAGSDGIHSDSFPYPYVSWRELITFLDFDNTLSNHGGGDQTKPLESLVNNNNKLIEKTGYEPFLVVIPGGTTGYPEVCEELDWVYHFHDKLNLNYGTDSLTKASFLQKTGMLGRKTYDGMTFEQLCSYISSEASRSDHPFIFLGGHVIADANQQINWSDSVKPFFIWLNDTYGKDGDDSIWVAGIEEIYEYLFTRFHSVVTKQIQDDILNIKVKVAKLPLFKRKEFSLIATKSEGSFGEISNISILQNVVKHSFSSTANKLLINVNYNDRLLTLAEKYTSLFETAQSNPTKDDALFFSSRLRDELAQPFLSRINAGEVAPTLNSVSINSGASSTYDRNVTIAWNKTGVTTHYRISEASDLTDVPWIESTVSSVSVNLSEGYATKTLYVQIKNQFGESSILNDSIIYEEQPAITYTVYGEPNNASYGTVSPASQLVAQGGSASVTAAAEEGYEIGSWSGADSSSGVGETSGNASVSNVQSGKTIICNFIPSETPTPTSVTKVFFNKTYTQQGFSQCNIDLASAPLYDNNGNNILTYLRWDTAGSTNDKPTISTNSEANNTTGAPYVFDIYKITVQGYAATEADSTKRLHFSAANGTYRIKIYANTKNGTTGKSPNRRYAINGVEQTPSFEILNNVDNFLIFENVTPVDGKIVIQFKSNAAWVIVPINVIEIEKLS